MSEVQTNTLLEREDFGDVTVLRLNLPMLYDDEATASLFDQASAVVAEGHRSRLVLNCAAVEFLASMALGKLVSLMRKVHAASGRLTLCKLQRTVQELLRVTHLSDILIAYDDEQEAVRSFGQDAARK
jgi:anti-anti-sigma factor